MTPQPDPETLVYVLDDNADVCNAVSMVLSSAHLTSLAFTSVSEFWQLEMRDVPSCLIFDVRLPNGKGAKVPVLPVTFDGQRAAPQRGIPTVGADTRSVLQQIDVSDIEIAELFRSKVVADAPRVADHQAADRETVTAGG